MTKPDMPWKEAIITVLQQAGSALHYTEIAQQVAEQKLRKSLGATPANTVAMAISGAMRGAKRRNPFIKTEPGRFMLRDQQVAAQQNPVTESVQVPAEDIPVVKTVGMYWNIDLIDWKTFPRMLGRQQHGSTEVDFGPQIGIYLLYDRNRVIYVGRAIEQPMGQRLSQHLRDP